MSGPPKVRATSVLLVDGDVRTSERLASLLREDGFDVEVLGEGASALARLACPPLPDVLITELRMPLGDGATIARFAKTQHPGMQIVVLTRYPNLLVPGPFGAASPTVLSKPLDYARLLDLLSSFAAAGAAGGRTASPSC